MIINAMLAAVRANADAHKELTAAESRLSEWVTRQLAALGSGNPAPPF